MELLTVTLSTAAAAAILNVWLMLRVGAVRQAEKISVGDEDNENLIRRMRAQANCAEYAPFGLLLLLMLEMQGGNVVFVHAMGLCLLLGRAAHAYGFASKPMNLPMRQLGMVLTFIQLIATSIALLLAALL